MSRFLIGGNVLRPCDNYVLGISSTEKELLTKKHKTMTKDGLTWNELTELLNELIEICKQANDPVKDVRSETPSDSPNA